MTQFAVFICVILLLSCSSSENANAPPESITIHVRNDAQEIILNLKQTNQYLANTNLPIWRARKNEEPELNLKLMQTIGEFTMYHDPEMSSAVILFHKAQNLYGVIDTRFYIKSLPLRNVGPHIQHIVGDHHIQRRGDRYFHDKFYDSPTVTGQDRAYLDTSRNDPTSSQPPSPDESPSILNFHMFDTNSIVDPIYGPSYDYTPYSGSYSVPNNNGRTGLYDIDPQIGPSRAHHDVGSAGYQVGDILYPEILVFITNDVVRYFFKRDPTLKLLVAYYLIHFNAIDMLFSKLADTIKIRLNLAGLVIESDQVVFPLIRMPGAQPSKDIDGDETLRRFPEYINKYNNIFVRDSFDFFYVSTNYRIIDEGVFCDGLSIAIDNYYYRRNARVVYPASGVILSHRIIHADFVNSAHEIAHLMNVDHDFTTEGRFCEGQQCFAILQESGTYCRNCIKWSDKSIEEFKRYISFNIERCSLLNKPRSLHPYGSLVTTLTPNQQCTCYGYESHSSHTHLDEVMPYQCNTKLACANKNRPVNKAIPKPIDGTPCGLQNVCWQGECQRLEEAPFVQLLTGY